MAELKQHSWLIVIVVMLVIAKFIVVPVINWQDTIIADINLLTKKQAKITRVLAQEDENTELDLKLKALLEVSDELFVVTKNESSFKLEQQKMLETLLINHKLKSQNIGWQTPQLLTSLALTRYPIQLRFTGKTSDVIEFTALLENQKQLIEIDTFSYSFKGQNEKLLGQITASLILNLYANSQILSENSEMPL